MAYVNACPHQYLPLDHRGSNVLSADGAVLRCTNHSAGFRVRDGVGVEGLGQDCVLDAIPIVVDDEGRIRVRAALPKSLRIIAEQCNSSPHPRKSYGSGCRLAA